MQVVAHLAVKEQLRPVERPLVDEAAFLKHPARAEIIRVAGRGNQVEQHFLEAEARHRTHRLGHVSPAPVRRAEGIAERLRRAVLARAVPDKTDGSHEAAVLPTLDRPDRRLAEEHQMQNVL